MLKGPGLSAVDSFAFRYITFQTPMQQILKCRSLLADHNVTSSTATILLGYTELWTTSLRLFFVVLNFIPLVTWSTRSGIVSSNVICSYHRYRCLLRYVKRLPSSTWLPFKWRWITHMNFAGTDLISTELSEFHRRRILYEWAGCAPSALPYIPVTPASISSARTSCLSWCESINAHCFINFDVYQKCSSSGAHPTDGCHATVLAPIECIYVWAIGIFAFSACCLLVNRVKYCRLHNMIWRSFVVHLGMTKATNTVSTFSSSKSSPSKQQTSSCRRRRWLRRRQSAIHWY